MSTPHTELEAQTAQSPEAKRELLERLSRGEVVGGRSLAPLSQAQQAQYLLQTFAPHSIDYNLVLAVELVGVADSSQVQPALQQILARHPSLRTTYASYGGRPVQWIHEKCDIALETLDAQDYSDAQLRREIRARGDRPFQLEREFPIRATLFVRSSWPVILLAMHHIAADLASLQRIASELIAQLAGRSFELTAGAKPKTIRDYVAYEIENVAGPKGEQLWEYWRRNLQGELPVVDLKLGRALANSAGTVEHVVDAALMPAIQRAAAAQGTTVYTYLLSAFVGLLHRYTGHSDLLVGSPFAGARVRPEFRELVANLTNTVALRADLSDDPSFSVLVERMRGVVAGALEHQEFPFSTLVQRLRPERAAHRMPLIQTFFVVDDVEATLGEGTGDTQLRPLELTQCGAAFDLTLTMLLSSEDIRIRLTYRHSALDDTAAQRFAEQFEQLLRSVLADPATRVSELALFSERDRMELERSWSDARVELDRDALAHRMFQQQARECPSRIAVEAGAEGLTYAELDVWSNRIAHGLRARGVQRAEVVGLYLERSPEMLAAMLGILKAGAAYLPLDTEYPEERIRYMLGDAGVRCMLAQQHCSLSAPDVQVVSTHDFAACASTPLEDGLSGSDLAYIIYTSGSTGRPKGVEVTHGSLANFLASMARAPGMAKADVLLAVTTICFDIAALELFLPLSVGARVQIAPRGAMLDPKLLASLLVRSRATVMQATPTAWTMLLDTGFRPAAGFRALTGGEALSRPLAEKLLSKGAEVWNLYGPTETTVWSTVYRVQRDDRPISIGRPIANTEILIADRNRQPVPIGIPGRLWIGGEGVARGYRNRPDLTEQRFVRGLVSAKPDTRFYDTGDIVRYRSDGCIEYLGRDDHQVKLRGHRIELGEIEATLRALPSVSDAVVTLRSDADGGGQHLVAYLAARESVALPVDTLRAGIAARLPSYMIPAQFVVLDALPRTPNGKIDRAQLPEPPVERPVMSTQYVAPRTATEKSLVAIIESVLRLDKLGVHDSFFEMGGASIQILEVVAKASACGMHLRPEQIFESPTAASLAAELDRGRLTHIGSENGVSNAI